MGFARIPWTAIHTFAEAKGVTDQERFEHLIRAMDNEVIMAHNRRREEGQDG